MSKSNTPAPDPKSLDDQARECYSLIESNELVTAATYWDLGDVLRAIQKQHGWNYPKLLEHTTKNLKMNKSRVTRALRIRKQHPARKDVKGLSLYAALEHGKKEQTRTPQPVGSPLTAREAQAAGRFEQAVGGRERAVEVMTRIAQGEKPVKSQGNERVNALVKLVTPKRRSECKKDPQQFFGSMLADLTATLDEIRLSAAGKMAQRALRALMEDSEGVARRYLTVRQAESLGQDPLRYCADIQEALNVAMGVTPAAGQSGALPSPSAD